MLEAQGDSEALIGRLRELCDLADRMPQLPAELAAWYHVRLGHTLIDLGRLSEGREACRTALGVVPGEHAALVGLAEAEAAEGRWAETLRLAEEAARNAPADFEAVHLIARAEAALGRRTEPRRPIRGSSPWSGDRPGSTTGSTPAPASGRAATWRRRPAFAEADLALRQDAQGHETLALVLDRLGRRDRARTAIEAARKLAPEDPEIRRHADGILARP